MADTGVSLWRLEFRASFPLTTVVMVLRRVPAATSRSRFRQRKALRALVHAAAQPDSCRSLLVWHGHKNILDFLCCTRPLLAVSFKGVPGFLLQISLSVYCVEERHDSVAHGSCPQCSGCSGVLVETSRKREQGGTKTTGPHWSSLLEFCTAGSVYSGMKQRLPFQGVQLASSSQSWCCCELPRASFFKEHFAGTSFQFRI